MFDVVASLDAERYTAYRVASKEAAYYTYTKLVASALVLELCLLFLVTLTVGAFERHRLPLAVKSWQSNEFSLLLSN